MSPDPGFRHTLLAVDDTPENLDILKDLLKDRYRVLAVKSGAAALDLLARTVPLPSLVLLDIMMPDLDGFETLLRLRKIPGCEVLPVIFISAMDDTASKVKGLTLGAVDYITKPFEPEEVQARVRTHLALVEADRLRADVERIMRHDLKSPLNGILATAEFELGNDGDPGVRESFQVIADSAAALRDMIDLSLDLFKMEQGTYRPALGPVDLNALILRIRRELDPLLGAGDLTWTWGGSAPDDGTERTTLGVGLLCYSLLGNLVRNAVEASPRGGTITVTLEARADGGTTVVFRNAGEIPPAVRDRLFQKYATNGKISGTGLGLYSARLMAGNLGIGLGAHTGEPGHTTFRVEFPPSPRGGSHAQ